MRHWKSTRILEKEEVMQICKGTVCTCLGVRELVSRLIDAGLYRQHLVKNLPCCSRPAGTEIDLSVAQSREVHNLEIALRTLLNVCAKIPPHGIRGNNGINI